MVKESGISTREMSQEHPGGISMIKLEEHEDRDGRWIGKIEVG